MQQLFVGIGGKGENHIIERTIDIGNVTKETDKLIFCFILIWAEEFFCVDEKAANFARAWAAISDDPIFGIDQTSQRFVNAFLIDFCRMRVQAPTQSSTKVEISARHVQSWILLWQISRNFAPHFVLCVPVGRLKWQKSRLYRWISPSTLERGLQCPTVIGATHTKSGFNNYPLISFIVFQS